MASRGYEQVRKAAEPGHAARIVAEAEILAAAQMPGVVELIGLEDNGDRPVLVTARVDGPDLARLADLEIEEVAGVVAAVATTLADLHDLGLVHGAVTAEHVLLGADGGPVLCGFGCGGRQGQPSPMDGQPLEPAADVAALGALVVFLLEAASPASRSGAAARRRPGRLRGERVSGPRPGRRSRDDTAGSGAGAPAARRRPGRLRGERVSGPRPGRRSRDDTAGALRVVADRAGNADPLLRPSARSVADAVRLAVPAARLPRRLVSNPTLRTDGRRSQREVAGQDVEPFGCEAADPFAHQPPRRASPPTGQVTAARPPAGSRLDSLRGAFASEVAPVRLMTFKRLAGAGGLVALVVAGVFVVRLAAAAPAPRPSPAAAKAPRPTAPPAPPARSVTPPPLPRDAPESMNPAPQCPPTGSVLAADTDGDGCPEALQWADGVIGSGDRKWAVGQPGDQVAAADWYCSGRATLALLRPGTGEVFVFDGWSQPGRDLSASVAGRVEGGFALRAADLGGSCPRLMVERSGGPPVTMAVPGRP